MMLLNVQSMPGQKDILLTMEAIPTRKGFQVGYVFRTVAGFVTDTARTTRTSANAMWTVSEYALLIRQ